MVDPDQAALGGHFFLVVRLAFFLAVAFFLGLRLAVDFFVAAFFLPARFLVLLALRVRAAVFLADFFFDPVPTVFFRVAAIRFPPEG